jgi:hypothetical protein
MIADKHIALFLILLPVLAGCSESGISLYEDKETPYGEYLGEPPPDSIPKRFCPQFFSKEMHSPPVFSPDGMEVYWTLMGDSYNKILEMKREGDRWSAPAESPFNLRNQNDAPFLTPDGERIYFLSAQGSGVGDFDENMYYANRDGDRWSDPVRLPDIINDHPLHWQFSVAASYNLYFQDQDSHEIYMSEFLEGHYQSPSRLPESVNSAGSLESSPFIDPEEEFLIFCRMTNGFYTDLYISFKDSANTWKEAVSLGDVINTEGHDMYAYITGDRLFLFFLRSTSSGLFPFWVDAGFIDALR